MLTAVPFTSALERGSVISTGSITLPPESVIFGLSAAMQSVRDKIERVKGNNLPVLIQGESGTGKEIIARFLHERSPWGDGPLVKVSCPAIPSTLMESELFGYERGAFTGAYGTKPGRVELAHHGTLFLDEIGDLDLSLQSKLLQVLQDGQFSRIGSQRDKRVDVRVVCATNRQLSKEIAAGTFRQDLYYRINVVPLQLPPLRSRREDIPALAAYLLALHCEGLKTRAKPLSASLVSLFTLYDWPGNIRQLENLIKRYVILGTEDAITDDLLTDASDGIPPAWLPGDGAASLKELTQQAVAACERAAILKALQMHQWNQREAAKSLCVSYRTLLYKMRDAGIPGHKSNGGIRRSRAHEAEDQLRAQAVKQAVRPTP